jgi:hypothetical protein
MIVENTNSGTNATALNGFTSDTSTSYFGLLSSGYTSLGLRQANKLIFEAGGATDGLNLYTVNADPVQIGTDSAVRMTVDGVGLVGVGTTTPKSILELSVTGSNSALLLPRDTTANRPGGNVTNGMMRYNTTDNKFEFYQNGAWVNFAASSGSGSAFTQGGNAFGQVATLGTTDVANLNIITDGSTRMTVTSTGNVGIGTTNPQAPLHVFGSTTSAIYLSRASDVTKYASFDYSGSSLKIGPNGTDELHFQTNSTTRLTVYGSTGNVGIKTTTPNSLLEVNGTASAISYKGDGNSLSNINAVKLQTYDVASTAPTSGKVLTWNSVISKWNPEAASGGGANGFVQGGNAFGQVATLGTTDVEHLNIITGGSTRMTVTSTGNVGIGTSTPKAKVSISRGSSPTSVTIANEYLHLGGNYQNVGGLHVIGFGYTSPEVYPNAYMGFIETSAANSGKGDLVFGTKDNVTSDTAPVERMRIEATGNVGIKTTTPNSLLEVNGTASAISYKGDGNSLSNINAVKLQTYDVASTAPTSGKVLTWNSVISKWNPEAASGGGANGFVQGGNAFGEVATLGTTDTANLNVITGNTTRMTVTSTGNIGIGTSTPDSLVTIAKASGVASIPGTNSKNTILHLMGANGDDIRLLVDAFGTGSQPILTTRTARGTASNPTALQSGDIIGWFSARGYGTTGYGGTAAGIVFKTSEVWTDTAQGAYMAFSTSANGTTAPTERMRIDQVGNVGIGTTAPAEALDVVGNINVSGKITANQAFVTLTDGATITWNVGGLVNNAIVTLGGNRTLAFSGLTSGMSGTIIVKQDGTGSRTLTLPSQCTNKVIGGAAGVATLTATASAIDILTFVYDGTNCYWTYGNNYN